MQRFPRETSHRLAAPRRQCKRALQAVGWLAAAVLTGCAAPPKPEPPTPATPPLDAAYATIPGTRYAVEPGETQLILRVYRDGPLKALGHNHVITTDAIEGIVLIADDVQQSRADLWLSAADLIVDDPAARAAAGTDFESEPTRSDIEGTRANMLGARVLDAASHPRIHVGIRFGGIEQDRLQLTATIDAAGGSAVLPVAARIKRTPDRLGVEAAFQFDQRDLGIEPFSVLGGALRVAPVIDVAISLTARPCRSEPCSRWFSRKPTEESRPMGRSYNGFDDQHCVVFAPTQRTFATNGSLLR